MTSRHGNPTRDTVPLWGLPWTPLTKGHWSRTLMFSMIVKSALNKPLDYQWSETPQRRCGVPDHWQLNRLCMLQRATCFAFYPQKCIWQSLHLIKRRQWHSGHFGGNLSKLFSCIKWFDSNLTELFWFKLQWNVFDGPINNKPALVKIMALHGTYDKSLSEPVMV